MQSSFEEEMKDFVVYSEDRFYRMIDLFRYLIYFYCTFNGLLERFTIYLEC